MTLSPTRRWFLAAIGSYVLAIILGYFFIFGEKIFSTNEAIWPRVYFIVGHNIHLLPPFFTDGVLWSIIGWGPSVCLFLALLFGIAAEWKAKLSIFLKVTSSLATITVLGATQVIIIVLAIGASPRGLGGP